VHGGKGPKRPLNKMDDCILKLVQVSDLTITFSGFLAKPLLAEFARLTTITDFWTR
jgi:hypothetical protein